jgi:antitoxin (DNA-binding transcriptional repressor) of toxin-antitoxin stability system
MTKTFDLTEETPPLSELLSLAREGHEVVLMEGETLLARLVPAQFPPSRVGGLNEGAIWTSDDFDTPLPDKFWLGKS